MMKRILIGDYDICWRNWDYNMVLEFRWDARNYDTPLHGPQIENNKFSSHLLDHCDSLSLESRGVALG
jgi:hypothetical protein